MELEREIKLHQETINQKDLDMKSKNDQLEREKKMIDELEKAAQNRIY